MSLKAFSPALVIAVFAAVFAGSLVYGADDGFYVVPVVRDQAYYDARYVLKSGDTMTGELKANSLKYNQSQTRHISIPGNAFLPSDATGTSMPHSRQNAWLLPNHAQLGTYYAPVYLPHGAIITGLTACVCDLSATQDIVIALMTEPATYENLQAAKQAFSSGSNFCGVISDTGSADVVVDNEDNLYYVSAQNLYKFDASEMRLRWVRIDYTVSAPLP